jgi:8-oxo-dGTP diphosphatase
MTRVEFYECDYESLPAPTYVIIGASYRGQWLFVKSRKRGSYELPAGHIDAGESVCEAAGRELMEETGARKFILECINTYSVTEKGSVRSGKLFFASIIELAEIEDTDEIEDCLMSNRLPDMLTFPAVQEKLFYRLEEFKSTKFVVD